ncbi:rod shape-determining protein MreD [Planococcus versutus]|uniref:Rod shape-determining protein MreD n=1 Tax=Planococcus versutus TaxID=1302659 RepID=A0A1B1RXI0_9BACL|nr:rod shape-determining protein MreD [Planococcus versutus]ANU25636.1 rod shape-determining protein MreD [Planococcus versutus]
MIRFLIPLICLVLFFMEPVFGLFSPLVINGELNYIVPRFLIMFLIFVTLYYDVKHAVFYGLFFGLLYDVFYIDIIGLYSFLYPAICLVAASVFKRIPQNLVTATLLTLVLLALFEFLLYQFFLLISLTGMPLDLFVTMRLWPTMVANSIFLVMLGWVFKSVMVTQLSERDHKIGLY